MNKLLYKTTPDYQGDHVIVHGKNGPVVEVRREADHKSALVTVDDAIPLARAILDAAGVEADVVERVEDDQDGLDKMTFLGSRSVFRDPDEPTDASDELDSAADWRRLAALALARARAIDAELDPAVVEALSRTIAETGPPFNSRHIARALAAAGWRKEQP